MKLSGKYCIDCGSEAVTTTVDEVKPVFRMEIVNYACGAELRTIFSANGNRAKVVHSGCTHESGL